MEIVLMLTIFGLVAAFALPSFIQAVRRQNTIAAADMFAREHELARSTAVRYGRVARLHIDAANGQFWVDVDSSAAGVGVRAVIGPIRSVADQGVTFTSADTLMCFDPRGLPSTANAACQGQTGTLVFSLAGRSDSAAVTVLGKVLR
jgi:Tfp pilus assembly protein FimT